jgi:hypothetical protein
MKKTACLVVLLFAVPALCGPVESLQPGQWYEVPNSHMKTLDPCPAGNCSYSGVEGQNAVMGDWCGGAFDTQNNRLLVWGGGHGGYHGNEVYAFSVSALSWRRLCNPSSASGWNGSTAALPDGTPASIHTYDQETFIPGLNKLWVTGESSLGGNGGPATWLFTPDVVKSDSTGTWQRLANFPNGGISVGGCAVYDPATQHVFATNSSSYTFYEYNPSSDAYVSHSSQPLPDYHMTAAIDPVDHYFVATGGNVIRVYSLPSGTVVTSTATGDKSVQNGNAPGLVWYPAANLFVGWNGGSSLYTLNPKTWMWSAHPAASGNAVTPTAPNSNGTFGRFQYDAAHNVFVVVNQNTENVFIYKPDFSGTGAEGGVPGKAASMLTVSPNPFGSKAIVSFANPGKSAELSVYDVSGRLVKTFVKIQGSSVVLDAHDLINGLYFLKATVSGQQYTKRLMLQK